MFPQPPRALHRRFAFAAWAAFFACAASVSAAEIPLSITLDGLAVLRTAEPVPYYLTLTVLNPGPVDEPLTVVSAEVLDAQGRAVETVSIDQTAAGLGDIWERLEPLLGYDHDEVFLYAEAETALDLFERAGAARVQVEILVPLARLVRAWKAGTQVRLPVRVTVKRPSGEVLEVVEEASVDIAEGFRDPRLPAGAPDGFFFRGDTHVHSAWTDCDGIAFRGRFPIANGTYNPRGVSQNLVTLAKNAGLDWFALTDHCYCVDQTEYGTIADIAATASDATFLVLPGLEISAREKHINNGACTFDSHNTAHFNGFGLEPTSSLFQYTIDGARFACDAHGALHRADAPSIQAAIQRLGSEGNSASRAVSLNHPGGTGIGGIGNAWNLDPQSFFCSDSPTETGLEVINELWDDNQDAESVEHWIKFRLRGGHRVAAYGGSDTHQGLDALGKTFTGVFAQSLGRFETGSVEAGLREGRTFASSGPGLLALWAGPSGGPVTAMMGDTLSVPAGTAIDLRVSYADGGKPIRICLERATVGETDELAIPFAGRPASSPCVVVTGEGELLATLAAPERETLYRTFAIGTTDSHWRAYGSPLWLRP